MNYIELNEQHRKKIKSCMNSNIHMDWEDWDIMNEFLGNLPEFRIYNHDDDRTKGNDFNSIIRKIKTYDSFTTDKNSFINDLDKMIKSLNTDITYVYEQYKRNVENILSLHKFCLISGEGGIGKSYFIYKLEEELQKLSINHLCIYGKILRSLSDINLDEIVECSESGFLFVFDAVNEISLSDQWSLVEMLKELKQNSKIRIIVTYRTNSMNKDILNQLKEIAEYEYPFSGVSYESALNELMRLEVPNVYKYEDILYSNNALLLNALCKVLSNPKLVKEKEDSLVSVTFILEHYIKSCFSSIYKNIGVCGKDVWEKTKSIVSWMYENNTKFIDVKSLYSLMNDDFRYVDAMKQIGLLTSSYKDEENSYVFLFEILVDYLFARFLFDDIRGKTLENQTQIISKKKKLIPIHNIEPIILVLFDNYKHDYKSLIVLLKNLDLFSEFSIETIPKIKFQEDNIKDFQELFKARQPIDLFTKVAGYSCKPYNCTNFFANYFFNNRENELKLSKVLEEHYYSDNIQRRLKNILYFVSYCSCEKIQMEEIYYFSLFCCAAPNKNIRLLSTKVLFEVLMNNEEYINRVVVDYFKLSDFYIKECIIHVLSYQKKNNNIIENFFHKLIKNEKYICENNIKRMSNYLGDNFGYIHWQRENLFTINKENISEDFLNILSSLDMIDKNFLHLKYKNQDEIELYDKFLDYDKNLVCTMNEDWSHKFNCLRSHEIGMECGLTAEDCFALYPNFEKNILDHNSFLKSFEMIMWEVFDFYKIEKDKNILYMSEQNFINTLTRKCIDIANGIYYGSLMCNYYSNTFITYPTDQNIIGFEVYNPLYYGEQICVASPIPTFQETVERLDDLVLKNYHNYLIKDEKWHKNVELTKENILNFLKPISFENIQWVMIGGRIAIKERDDHDITWMDTYDIWCCTSEEETIENDGNARYLTIELKEYNDCLSDYYNVEENSSLCKSVKEINYDSNVFDSTFLVLPPADIINYFKLKINVKDMTWRNDNDEIVIICNNNKNSYYTDAIGGSVFIQKAFLDEFIKHNPFKYFSFTERMIHNQGYADETALHFEIKNNEFTKQILNSDFSGKEKINKFDKCKTCQYKRDEQNLLEDIKIYLDYGSEYQ